MLLYVVPFLLFTHFASQAMDSYLFFEQHKHEFDNLEQKPLCNYIEKIQKTIKESSNWQHFLDEERNIKRAIEYIPCVSIHIKHEVVAAIILNTPSSINWVRSRMQATQEAALHNHQKIYIGKKPVPRMPHTFFHKKLIYLLKEKNWFTLSSAQSMTKDILSIFPLSSTLQILSERILDSEVDFFKQLLSCHFPINTKNNDGDTLLHLAIAGIQPKITQLAIEYGANITIMNSKKQTALEHINGKTVNRSNTNLNKNYLEIQKMIDDVYVNFELKKQALNHRLLSYCLKNQNNTTIPILLVMQRH